MILLLFAAALLTAGCGAALFAAEDPNLAIAVDEWKPNEDGGNPPRAFPETSIQPAGSPALRLIYTDSSPHWGNVARPVQVPPTTRAVSLRFYKHSASPGAALHLWLKEPDGDAWVQEVVIEGKGFGDLTKGWHDVQAAVGSFRHEPRGDGKRGMAAASSLMVGCNFADLDVSFQEIRFILAGETPGASPAVLPPPTPEEGEKGRVAILSENFVERRANPLEVLAASVEDEREDLLTEEDEETGSPSAADPQWLAEMARRAGYGATLLSASALESPGYLSPNSFDILIIPSAPYYPLPCAGAIRSFLSGGGSLFTTGGYAFDRPCVRAGGGWLPVEQSLTVEEVDKGIESVGLNHRFGIPGDGRGPQPGQIPLFDPANPLKSAAYAESLVPFIPRVRLDGPFEGWAASALLGSNDPVFPKAYARRIPLLMSYDQIGREAGAIGQIVHNFAGPFKGSSWAAFGVTNTDLFSRSGPLSMEFGDILDRLLQKVYLRSLKTDLALYKPGESATLSAVCENLSKQSVKVWVRFEIQDRDGIPVGSLAPVEQEIAAGFEQRVESIWSVPPGRASDLYRVRCQMVAESLEDEMTSAFCVDDPALRAKGFPLAFRDNYFRRGEAPAFLIGTNQTGAVFSSEFENPLVWERDLKAMRSNGLSIMRVLHFSPYVVSETGTTSAKPLELGVDRLPKWLERKLDALVQLSARHQIVLFLTLHDWMGVNLTDEELAAQRKFAKLVAGRYADCPHVMYDVQNEPNVQLGAPESDAALWNRFLQEKYGDQAALAAAWGAYLGDEKLGSVSLAPTPGDWPNVRAADQDLFRAWLFNRWMAENAAGVRDASKALVTVGYLQTVSAADQLMGNVWQDFTNKHYYGAKEQFPHEIKLIDRRFAGKGFSAGEFGSLLDQQARIQGRSREEADWDWFYEVAGTTLGLGGAFVLNWCWKEMPDNVFPWGISSPNDDVPRETLLAFRAFALATRGFVPAYASPAVFLVVPDLNRMGAGGETVNRAVYNAIDALIRQRVEFGVINEMSLKDLPPSAKAVFLPVPYLLSDDAFASLKSFVGGGGTLYVSGDITFDAARKRTRQDRLKDLFGLEFRKEAQAPLQAGKAAGGNLLPAIEVAASGADQAAETGLWLNKCGGGQAVFNPVSAELAGMPVLEYAKVLDLAGIERFPVTPDDPSLIVYRTGGADEQAWFLYNRGEKPVGAALPGATQLRIEPGRKALVITKAGQVTSLIAQGAVKLAGKDWAEFGAECMAVSLDGKPLADAGQIALCPLGTCEIRLRGFAGGDAEAWVGEVDGDRWTTLARRSPQQAGGLLIIPAETSLRFSLIVLGPRAELQTAADTLARRLAFSE